MSLLEQFDNAVATVTVERGKNYGRPLDTFNQIVSMQIVLNGCKDMAVRHAMEMICVKLVRLAKTPDHLDSVIDIAGYARTIAMILESRATEKTARVDRARADTSALGGAVAGIAAVHDD